MFDVSGLTDIPDGKAVNELEREELILLQRGLGASCYDAGPVDGLIGRRTRTAYADLIDDLGLADVNVVHLSACGHLDARATQLREIINRPASTLDETKERIREACVFAGLGMPEQIAYALATADHETNHTFKPVREAYWVSNAEAWRKANLSYWPYYGRGYVQLTHDYNYKLYSGIIGLDLLADPDAALRHDFSLFVLVQGMKIGGFTRKPLEKYVSPGHVDFFNARRVINGLDKAQQIADLAQTYV